MADYPRVSSDDGLRVTISELVKDPLVIPAKAYEDVKAQYFAAKLLRSAGTASGGTFTYYENEGAFADDDPKELEEWEEIPLTSAKRGKKHSGYTTRWGRGLRISDQTVSRSNYDQLATDLGKLKNNWARFDENLALTQLMAALPTFTADNWNVVGAATTNTTDTVFGNVFQAKFNIENSDETSNGAGQQKMRFSPDTLVLNRRMATILLLNRDLLNTVSNGNVADRNTLLRGGAEGLNILGAALGVSIVLSDLLDPDKAI